MNYLCEINWLIVIDFLKLITSWPIVTLIIFILIIKNFKAAISSWIEKFSDSEFEVLGQKVKISVQQQPVETQPIQEIIEKVKAAERSDTSKIEKQYEIPEEINYIPDVNNMISYAESHPVESVVELSRALKKYHFERVFNAIFGSQINLLEYLETAPEQWLGVSHIAGFHTAHKQSSPNANTELFTYLNYLSKNGLIEVVLTNEIQTIRSTKLTKEFLNYLKEWYPNTWNKKQN